LPYQQAQLEFLPSGLCILPGHSSGYPSAYLLYPEINQVSLKREGGGDKNITLKIISKDK